MASTMFPEASIKYIMEHSCKSSNQVVFQIRRATATACSQEFQQNSNNIRPLSHHKQEKSTWL